MSLFFIFKGVGTYVAVSGLPPPLISGLPRRASATFDNINSEFLLINRVRYSENRFYVLYSELPYIETIDDFLPTYAFKIELVITNPHYNGSGSMCCLLTIGCILSVRVRNGTVYVMVTYCRFVYEAVLRTFWLNFVG